VGPHGGGGGGGGRGSGGSSPRVTLRMSAPYDAVKDAVNLERRIDRAQVRGWGWCRAVAAGVSRGGWGEGGAGVAWCQSCSWRGRGVRRRK
jgi:hypothetical protein